MRTLDEWFREYEVSHRNPSNILIHKICVPAILFAALGLLWELPFNGPAWYQNTAVWAGGATLAFYASLSIALTLGIILEMAVMTYIFTSLAANLPHQAWLVYAGVFVVAWIFQFIGHKIEGKKPSFFQDLVFLLIGPLWTLDLIYGRLGAPSRARGPSQA